MARPEPHPCVVLGVPYPSQRAAAEDIGVAPPTVSRWIKNRKQGCYLCTEDGKPIKVAKGSTIRQLAAFRSSI